VAAVVVVLVVLLVRMVLQELQELDLVVEVVYLYQLELQGELELVLEQPPEVLDILLLHSKEEVAVVLDWQDIQEIHPKEQMRVMVDMD
jgi:hypothetical protein